MSELKKIASLEGVVFNYPAGNNALDRITLDLHQGEILGLVGANGAGKTTLMKLLAGYMDKTDGRIVLGGKPIEEYSNRRLNEFVTLVEQNPESQLVGPTVEDELARACRLMGYEGRVIREKVDFVLKLVRMKQAKEWYLDEMSSGERRRVALALALVADPQILMLDEPLSDLDSVGQKDTASTIRELRSRGLCVIVSSHRLEDILELTDRIAVLGEGRLLVADDPQKVLTDEETLKLAAIQVPSVQRLYLRLQADGLMPLGRLPMGFDEALERFREELDRRKKSAAGAAGTAASAASAATGTMAAAGAVASGAAGALAEAEKAVLAKFEAIANGATDGDKTLVLDAQAGSEAKDAKDADADAAGKESIASKLSL